MCGDCISFQLWSGKGRKHWQGDVLELLGLPTNAQVCTMLTCEPGGVPSLSGLRCILNVYNVVWVVNPAILTQWENANGPGYLSGSIYSGRLCSPIATGFYDCIRIAVGLWIAT